MPKLTNTKFKKVIDGCSSLLILGVFSQYFDTTMSRFVFIFTTPWPICQFFVLSNLISIQILRLVEDFCPCFALNIQKKKHIFHSVSNTFGIDHISNLFHFISTLSFFHVLLSSPKILNTFSLTL